MVNLLVYFGNHLPKEKMLDPQSRKEALDKGLQALGDIPDLSVLQTLELTSAALIQLTSTETRKEFERVLQSLEPKAVFVEEPPGPTFRASTDAQEPDTEDFLLAHTESPLSENPKTIETW